MQVTETSLTTAKKPRSISEIQKTMQADLDAFQIYFRDAMKSDVSLLDRVVQYLLRQKGKRLRPLLVMLSAQANGGVSESSYRAAALIELLHTATLVHDDVVDEADRRRGVFSINAVWKNKIAVLLGDFLLSRGLLLAVEHEEHNLLRIVSKAVKRMSEGELLQIEKARKLDIDEATYFRIISDKTASLISACTECGAASADADPEATERMMLFGEKLGLAFQIRDDLFDFGVKDVGKPLGIDLKEKKMTLPLIYGLEHTSVAERKSIIRIVRKSKKSRGDVKRVAEFARKTGGVDYARERMVALADEAIALLSDLPNSDARTALEEIAAYTVSRSR
jgi:octaprenyl-diphosphate synthase